MSLDAQTLELVNIAERIYNEKLKTRLEADRFGELIALEPESGDFVLGRTFREIDQAAQHLFGSKPTSIFRIDGGGAVKIGGVGRNAW